MLPILAGAALSGGLSLIGQSMANETNVSLARESNQMNMAEAQRNRDFQEQMSNTAHQREMADLKAAGLNPLLSGTGGNGASTPSGSSGNASPGRVDNLFSGGITSAMDAIRTGMSAEMQGEDLLNKKESRNLIKAQTADALAGARAKGALGVWSDTAEDARKGFSNAMKKISESISGTYRDEERVQEQMKKNAELIKRQHEQRVIDKKKADRLKSLGWGSGQDMNIDSVNDDWMKRVP